MGKKKPSGELKSVSVPFQVQRYRDIKTIQPASDEHWGVQSIQPFFPSLETMFKMENVESVREHGLKLDETVQSIQSKTSITTSLGERKDIHIKQTMLVNPFRWMKGEYGGSLGLPTIQERAAVLMKRVQSPHNAAYVGSLFSALFSQSGCIHFPKVYGVYTGIAKKHKIDISDDYPDIVEKPWFSQNLGSTFELTLGESVSSHSDFQHTRSARSRLLVSDEISLGEVEDLPGMDVDGNIEIPNMDPMFEDDDLGCDSESDCSSVSTSYVFGVQSCDCEDFDDDEEEDGEAFAWATMSNIPVQLTVMEKCEGTLYDLMCLEPETTKHIAWLAQILFALTFAQRTFGFTHNDLHSNNIMYVKTDKEFLNYKVDGQSFKVPTHGYLLKIIDFERGAGSVRISGMNNPKFFMSDHFSVEEEAGGQYNVEPFYVAGVETVKPNPSFDLVRLATSLFWDLFPEGPAFGGYSSNPIFKTLIRWLTLEDGTSILFGKTHPSHDRYHGFDLYKAIARFCKDTAVPRSELQHITPMFGVSGTQPVQYDLVI
jgi:hypothetical protein